MSTIHNNSRNFAFSPMNTIQHAKSEVTFPINRLPRDILLQIFLFLGFKDLSRASGVCRNWRVLSTDAWNLFDINKLFPSFRVINGTVWKKHVNFNAFTLSVDDEPILTKRDLIIRMLCLTPELKRIEDNAGITFLTLPKWLTLRKLYRFAQTTEKGNAIKHIGCLSEVLEQYGDDPLKKTRIVIISNAILKGTRNMTSDQQDLFLRWPDNFPKILDISALIIMTYLNSDDSAPDRAYIENSKGEAFTRCWNGVYENYVLCGRSTGTGQLEIVSEDKHGYANIGVGMLYGSLQTKSPSLCKLIENELKGEAIKLSKITPCGIAKICEDFFQNLLK